MTDTLILKQSVLKRLAVNEITNVQACEILKLSVRQIQRLKIKYNSGESLIHGLTNQQRNRSLNHELKQIASSYLKEKYFDFGSKFASEQLKKNENISLSKTIVRNLMIKENLWHLKSRKLRKTFQRRQRKDQYGEMIQLDGSYHRWFEERAPKCYLLVAVDDATGRLMKLTFCNDESVVNVMIFWKEYIIKYGKPIRAYLDNFSTYKVNAQIGKERGDLTQFERAMEAQLNINVINALTPQAKGRVERMNKTLQDRLVKELRLNNISTIAEANIFVEQIFIPQFNVQFVNPLKSCTVR